MSLAAVGPPSLVPHHDSPEPSLSARLIEVTRDVKPRLVVDIVGMRDRSVDVCLGRGPNPTEVVENFVETARKAFLARGVRVQVDEPFPGKAPYCVTSFCQGLQTPALQVAVGAWMRDPARNPVQARLVVDVLRGATLTALTG
jgi:hypothetical protein